MATEKKVLLISVLSLGRPQNVGRFLTDMPAWLEQVANNLKIEINLVVRNNDPSVSFEGIRSQFDLLNKSYRSVCYTLITGGPNLGFGGGHNENFRLLASNYLLILNDDIGFPHLKWLPEALRILDSDNRIACVGASENPQYLDPTFGNGLGKPHFGAETLKYVEGSIALFNSGIFWRLGMFDSRIEWAMCEDADLSLRAQQQGYRLRWISMPHQHWRSTTFNALPEQVKASILEHNRATIFASWGRTLATGRVGSVELYDLWSDGMGDVFCTLPHLLSHLKSLTPDQRARIVINTSYPELINLMNVDDIKVTTLGSQQEIQLAFATDGISTVHSIRDINYALPLGIHAILCGALSILPCNRNDLEEFRATLRRNVNATAAWKQQIKGRYCVVNLEFQRSHEGRGLAIPVAQEILQACCNLFETVVVVGKEEQYSLIPFYKHAENLVNLQACLSLVDLISVIGEASYFVGIDSFPAHVAQALSVSAAVFFGAVHPLARVWDEQRTWPIVAELPCIGCYHTHIEPSATFCMRRDEACTTNLDIEEVKRVLESLINNEKYSWSEQRSKLQRLQSKWIGLMRHHPAPPDRLTRSSPTGNLLVSNTIYRILDHLSELTYGHYPLSEIGTLIERIAHLEAEVAVQVSRPHENVEIDVPKRSQRKQLDKMVVCRDESFDLLSLKIKAVGCRVVEANEWLEVHSLGLDPQLILPAISDDASQVDLTLEVVADHNDYLQLFWSKDEEEFSEERQHYQTTSSKPAQLSASFRLASAETLRIRIDPSSSPGVTRLRGFMKRTFVAAQTKPSGGRSRHIIKENNRTKHREAKSLQKVAQPIPNSSGPLL